MSTHMHTDMISVESTEIGEARQALRDGTHGQPDLVVTIAGASTTIDWTWEGGPYAGVPDAAWPQFSLLLAMHWCPFRVRTLGYDHDEKVWLIKRDGYSHGSDSHKPE